MAKHADAAEKELTETDSTATSSASTSTNNADSLDSDIAPETTADTQPEESTADWAQDCDASVENQPDSEAGDNTPKKPRSPVRMAMVCLLVVFLALGGLGWWFGYQLYQSHQAQHQRQLLIGVARQGALNLTTIDWHHADADIQRILDSATGTFYDDFSQRSKPFVDVVKKAQSTSVGTISESGLESQTGDQAQVLVAVAVKTSNLGAAEQDPRHWRMRITVQKVGSEAKVSNVAFVP